MSRYLFVLGLLAAASSAAEIVESVVEMPDGSRVIGQAVTVPATPAEVWDAFTTAAGWQSWAVPFARVDLRVGGLIETSYDPAARSGDAANIHNRILSYLPMRMLSIQAVQAPPGFAHADKLPLLHSVIEIEPIDADTTRVTVSGVGYGAGPEFDELISFFRQGNAWSLDQLRARFESGPVDWTTRLRR